MKFLSTILLCLSLASGLCYSQENHLKGFEKTTDCAALMAVISQRQQGELSARQVVFEKIGYTLGKAENHRQDGQLKANTQNTYQQKVLALYQRLTNVKNAERQIQQQYQQCLKDAELYDPKTQIPALIEKARQQQP